MMINVSIVINVVGVILALLGGLMLTAIPFSFYWNPDDMLPIITSAITTFSVGITSWFLTRTKSKKIGKREGFLIVGVGWITVALFSALPYYFSSVIPEFTNCFLLLFTLYDASKSRTYCNVVFKANKIIIICISFLSYAYTF